MQHGEPDLAVPVADALCVGFAYVGFEQFTSETEKVVRQLGHLAMYSVIMATCHVPPSVRV